MKFYFATFDEDNRLLTYDHNGVVETVLVSEKGEFLYYGLANILNATKCSYVIPPTDKAEYGKTGFNPKEHSTFLEYMEICFEEFELLLFDHILTYFEDLLLEIHNQLLVVKKNKHLLELKDIYEEEVQKAKSNLPPDYSVNLFLD